MQILVNLIENARQAMDAVPGERVLRVTLRRRDGWIALSVSDNGCGIAPDHLPRIFSHGFTTKPDGHGFGLHSCAVAAREMGGRLMAHSDGPGRGATFTLELRASPVAARAQAGSQASGEHADETLVDSR
jgi:C4-dicarboxylate-specific signal transduction histidine kinase